MYLASIVQGPVENLEDFVKRFRSASTLVVGFNPSMALAYLYAGL